MDTQQFVKIAAQILTKSASKAEQMEFEAMLSTDPEFKHRFAILERYWRESRYETEERREAILTAIMNRMKE